MAHLDHKQLEVDISLHLDSHEGLTQQREHALLHLVGLRQRRDTGLIQDVELRHVGYFLRDIGGADAIFRSSQVLNLVIDDVARTLVSIPRPPTSKSPS
jgi:hypothetical protein